MSSERRSALSPGGASALLSSDGSSPSDDRGHGPADGRGALNLRRIALTLVAAIPGVLGATVVGWQATTVTAPFRTDPLGPEGFLYFIAAGLLVGGVVTAISTFRAQGPRTASPDPVMAHDDEVVSLPEVIEAATEQAAVADGDADMAVNWRSFTIMLVTLIVYIALLPRVGYFPASIGLGLVTAWAAGERSPLALATASVGTTVLFWFIFSELLSIRLPGA